MNHPFGHDRLQNRYYISGKLLLDTPLRLSSGRASDETDAPLMRLFDDKTPLIPGSSLRGALRSELERIIAAVDLGAGLRSCALFSDNDCAVQFRNYQQAQRADLTDQQIVDYAQQPDHLCSVCRLFGAAFFASRLIIEDAVAKQPYPGRIRDGVGIDRDTGAARETVKFDYEVLELQSGTVPEFSFAMQVENLTAHDKQLIGIALALLKRGVHVGGKRATGLGRIKLADDYEIRGFASPAELWRRLQAGEDLYQKYLQWEDAPVC